MQIFSQKLPAKFWQGPLQVFSQLTQKDPMVLPVVVAVLMTSFQAGFYRSDPHLTVPWDGTVLGVFGLFWI